MFCGGLQVPPGPSSQGPTLGSQGPPGGPSWLLKPICPLSICAWKQENKINDQNKRLFPWASVPAASVGPWEAESYPCWGPACSHLLQMNELFIINKENGKKRKERMFYKTASENFLCISRVFDMMSIARCVCWIWYSDIIVVLIKYYFIFIFAVGSRRHGLPATRSDDNHS